MQEANEEVEELGNRRLLLSSKKTYGSLDEVRSTGGGQMLGMSQRKHSQD